VTCRDQYGDPEGAQVTVPEGGTHVVLPAAITSMQAVSCQINGYGNEAATFYNVIDNIVFQ
jgi:hypothetical protein